MPVNKHSFRHFIKLSFFSACAISDHSGAGVPLAGIWHTENGVIINEYGISGVKYERINKSNTSKSPVNGQLVLRQNQIFK